MDKKTHRVHHCHRSSVRPNLKTKPLIGGQEDSVRDIYFQTTRGQSVSMSLMPDAGGGTPTYPKKMKAFWKKTAMPGYTTGFSARDNRCTAQEMRIIYNLTERHIIDEENCSRLGCTTLCHTLKLIRQCKLREKETKGLTRHYESSKQNPHGGNEGAKSQHEADEEPHSSACTTQIRKRALLGAAAQG